MSNYKYCVVPMCTNSSIRTPEKVFISVPKRRTIRNRWWKAMKRDVELSEKTSSLVCEDHFDLEHDVTNYMQYRFMGRNVSLRVKKEVVPHKFECQRLFAPSRCTGEKREQKKILVAAMTGEAYDELWNLDWVGIPDFPYVMKYRFDEDGYILMVSDLAAVYAEKLDVKAIQERFQILNPYAEMLPKIILKHVKQSVKNILAGEQAHKPTELKITPNSNKVIIQHQFNTSGVRFMFNFEPHKLSDNQFKAHILRPTLLRALILDEEKAALQRKVEELEGRQSSSSSSRSSEKRNIKAIYSEIKESDPPVSGVIHAFLYLQKDKITVPESLKGTPNASPTKGIHTSSTSSFSCMKIKNSKNKARNIPYEEGDSDMSLESQNRIQQSEKPEISLKIEKIEDDESRMNEFDHSSNNLSAKNGEQSNKRLSPMKREMAEEDSKQESVSKPAPYLKPSPSKKKKLLKF